MGVLRDSGSPRLTLSSVAQPTAARDELLEAVRAGEFEVFGEIGRSPDGTADQRDAAGARLPRPRSPEAAASSIAGSTSRCSPVTPTSST